MPRRQRYGKSQSLGYAFINVASPTIAPEFMAAAENGALLFGQRVAKVVPASVQGIDALKGHFDGKNVMVCPVKPMFTDITGIEQRVPSKRGMTKRSNRGVPEVVAASTTSTRSGEGGKIGRASTRWCDIEDDFDDC
eukprot:TRINITY_DN40878_c0_g1_i2.p2 TRINITY_DN40878_c0_g1~~TRINITY_DN40878_c0_g1_i2.p2  ORF type:complete len:149 (-),score=36.42 TRINITY_DN40878_c0_g1_i2:87-497(-)